MNGAKQITETMAKYFVFWVGERSLKDTSLIVRTGVLFKEVNMLV